MLKNEDITLAENKLNEITVLIENEQVKVDSINKILKELEEANSVVSKINNSFKIFKAFEDHKFTGDIVKHIEKLNNKKTKHEELLKNFSNNKNSAERDIKTKKIKIENEKNINNSCGIGRFTNRELSLQRDVNAKNGFGPIIDREKEEILKERAIQDSVLSPNLPCKFKTLSCRKKNDTLNPLKDEFTRCYIDEKKYTGDAIKPRPKLSLEELKKKFSDGNEDCK